MKITGEMIEKAAQELYDCWNSEPGVKPWSLLTSLRTKPYRVAAERMLSAVAPLIRAEALEEAARLADAETAARNLNRTAALRGSQEWGVDTEAAAMAQGHKAITARDIAAAIRALKDTPLKTEPAT